MISRNLLLTILHRFRFTEANTRVATQGNGEQSNVLTFPLQKLMKKSMLLLVTLFIFTSVTLMAQSPQKINFQSIVRNTNGVIFSNKTLSFKISLLSGSITGTQVYSETHTSTTDAIGLVSLQIGSGTALSGVFANINWGDAAHFIKLEADFNGGNNYVLLGTQELMSVPYAMYASKTDTASLNLTNRFSTKLNLTDTASLSNRIDAKLNKTDTSLLNLTSRLAMKLNVTDTAFLSNRIDNKLNKTDTSLLNLTNRFLTKFNITDTMTMLSKYLRKEDFPSGSNVNEILYWNGTKWISLAPGTTGQSLIMSSTGLSWGCIITNTAAAPSSINPTLVVDTDMTPITIATTGATGIDITNSGLPAGVTAAWSANVITISGKPTALGSFSYKIPLTGGCGSVNATDTITVSAPSFTCGTSTVPDNDGNAYTTVSIGTQCWTKENLKVTTYNDGTAIQFNNTYTSGTVSTVWQGLTTGAFTIYGNESSTGANATNYGFLYNWYAAKGVSTSGSTTYKNICPTGWHVPTDTEWKTLTDYLGGVSVAGGKMKSTSLLWNSPNTGADNASGFTALPGGYRYYDGSFFVIRDYAFFWSATEFDSNIAWNRTLSSGSSNVDRNNNFKSVGASVRCLRD